MTKPILVSGIKPTGRLHLGNYLGALKQFVELQDSGKYQCYFFVADHHSLTNYEPGIGERSLDLVLDYLAAGLDCRKSTVFVQSAVPSHTELAWILSCITPLGDLYRMTQFKEKAERGSQNVGLLTYPVLMAADVFLYDAAFVPVGDDQIQHLELARELARRFNKRFGNAFVEPKPILSHTPRLMSLDDPTKKMSKSLPNGCLFLDDKPESIRTKFRKAVTDSGSEIKFDETNKPAIANLLLIYSELSGLTITEVEKKFKGKNYSQFKEAIAELVIKHFEPFNEKKQLLRKKLALVKKQLAIGNKKAAKIASAKMENVKRALFL